MRRIRATQGFTLIELMITVIIIGVLAALAIPRYMAATTRSKQSEAKAILKQIFINQCTYREQSTDYDFFAPGGPASKDSPLALSEIWIEIQSSARYSYDIVTDGTTFTATATANLDDDAAIDTWTIDEDGLIQNTVNDATES